MKTQTTQLSLLQTNSVSGGKSLSIEHVLDNSPYTLMPATPFTPAITLPKNKHITQALRETGGLFDIVG